ncbi:hypothetical protein AA0116_g10969 [Alternaria tenuissima]|jgi:hypothetical protein|nr:hypothetical protein AA0116_g10969 [Alternaria tenuissima]
MDLALEFMFPFAALHVPHISGNAMVVVSILIGKGNAVEIKHRIYREGWKESRATWAES